MWLSFAGWVDGRLSTLAKPISSRVGGVTSITVTSSVEVAERRHKMRLYKHKHNGDDVIGSSVSGCVC